MTDRHAIQTIPACSTRLHGVWILLLTALLFQPLAAQTLSGKVFVVKEPGDTTAVQMAQLQWLNTAVGTYSEMDGSFKLPYANTDTLVVRYSFYKTDTLIVNRGKKLTIVISPTKMLQEVVISKPRKQKYVRKGNPAVMLVEKVIENKNNHRIESAESYKLKSYKKMIATFGRFTMNFEKNRFNRQFSFLAKYIDTIPQDTVPVLTIALRENLSDLYYQKTPRKRVEYVVAERMQGFGETLEEEGMGTNLDAMFSDVNIFDNDIDLMLNKFVSPLSSTLATTYYHYYITDTVLVDSISCIELTFTPVNSKTFGFNGRMYIVNDSTYALKRYTLNVPVKINMNFVRQLVVEQDFTRTDSGWWAPAKAETFASFSLIKRKKMRQIYIRQNKVWYDFEAGVGIPDSLKIAAENGVVMAKTLRYRQKQWMTMRPVPLTAKEAFIDSLSKELRQLPVIKALETTAEILSTGYIATAKERKESRFDIGPVYNFVSYNPTEGVRLRLGGMTTAQMHNRWFFYGYLAYGLRDQRFKYSFTMAHSFDEKKRHINESPRHVILFTQNYDVEMPGRSYSYMDRDNFFMSYNTGDPELSAQYVRRTRLRYMREWANRFSVDTWLQYENNEATGMLAYWRINRDGTISPVKSFNSMEWRLQLRWAPGERVYNNQSGKDNLLRLSKNAPVFILTHTAGIMDQLRYHRTDFSVEKRFWLSAFGHIDAEAKGGIVWNAAPFPKLYFPPSNQSIFLSPNTFCLMKPMEFIMDRYVSLYATYHLKGWIFNRIPLWNRLNWREVISFSGIYGSITPKNIPGPSTPGLYVLPEGCGQMGKMPYMELTAGIENIFQVLRIDYVRRLTHTEGLKGWGKNGIRISMQISF